MNTTFEVEQKTLEPMLIAGIRMRGKYCECGVAFGKIGKAFGRHICGPGFLLHYDTEYKENDADFEACFPIRQGTSTDEITVRELPGGKCIALQHQGPYEDLGPAYDKICQFMTDNAIAAQMPSREVYLKGPGMIFKGNPKKYLTEIQMVLCDE